MLGRPNVFEIDLDAVYGATRRLREQLGRDVFFYATLKADGYGYGVDTVAYTVLEAGADGLSMSNLDDAVALRAAGIRVPILLYAGVAFNSRTVAAIAAHDIVPTICDEASFASLAQHIHAPLRVAVKVDVGPERIGVPVNEALALIERINAHPHLRVDVVNSHPNVKGGERAQACLDWQHERFAALQQALTASGMAPSHFVMASSKVLRMAGARMAFNAADPGAALFFQQDAANTYQAFHALKTQVLTLRTVCRTEFMDEAPFPMYPGMRVGILPMGYSDGIDRMHVGHVLIRGKKVPVLGRAALEYLRVDLSEFPDVQVGDEVVILGRQGDVYIDPEDAARLHGVGRAIDLALQVGSSVQRRYLRHQRYIS